MAVLIVEIVRAGPMDDSEQPSEQSKTFYFAEGLDMVAPAHIPKSFRSIRVVACILAGLPLAGTTAFAGVEDDPRGPAEVSSVASSRSLIRYQVRPGSGPLEETQLWFTEDRGRTWRRARHEAVSPGAVTFDAPGDGLFGVYFVLRNARGRTPEPEPGTRPHRWIRVDRSAPIVKILALRGDARFDLNREIHLRWSVEDEALGDRPVSLHYRTEQTGAFKRIAHALAVNGSYRWTVPEGVGGRLEIKVSAVDRAGNRGRELADWLWIKGDRIVRHRPAAGGKTQEEAPRRDPTARGNNAEPPSVVERPLRGIHNEPDAGRPVTGDESAIEAMRQYELGTWHRLRGEYQVAIARYRGALALEPGLLPALNDLSAVRLVLGQLDKAEEGFRRILGADSSHRAALKGLALTLAKARKYRSAHETLQKLLLVEPNDGEAWLHFGDVCMFIGDRSSAREAWLRVGRIDGVAAEIRARAEKRLDIYRSDRLAEGVRGGPQG